MATYAMGDIQGCYQTFIKLLNKIEFNFTSDQLWLVGDMINRGKDSLKVLEFIIEHQASIRCVLGNHDLHFLAVAHGVKQPTSKDTLNKVLKSAMLNEIVDYLLNQPLFYYDKKLDFAMVHAGIPINWSLKQVQSYANEVSEALQSKNKKHFFETMYGNHPKLWDEKLTDFYRLRYITNALTRIRCCEKNGALELKYKGPLKQKPKHLIPWYELSQSNIEYSLVFGHWASLEGKCPINNIYALDTGCVWGGKLTALRLNDQKAFSCHSIE